MYANFEQSKWPDFVKFIIGQKEQGEGGRPHIQAYVEFTKQLGLKKIKQHWPTIHIEGRRGSQAQAINYVTKTTGRLAGPWSFGTKNQSGKRTDIIALRKFASSNKPLKALPTELTSIFSRSTRAFFVWRSMHPPPARTTELAVTLIVGKTGVGKSRYVYDRYQQGTEMYANPVGKGLWFDGYDQQPTVLIDEYEGQWPLHELLRILDRYPIQLPIKGGFVWFLPDEIYVTTNRHPKKWYNYHNRECKFFALARRITKVLCLEDGVEKSYEGEAKTTWFGEPPSYDIDQDILLRTGQNH